MVNAKLTPYIISEDARAQAEFYVQALGGEIVSVVTQGQALGEEASEAHKDKVLHLSIVAAGVPFFFTDSVMEPSVPGNSLNLSLEFPTEEDAHAAFAKLSEGGKVNHPLERAFWGALFGQLEDKFGVLWMITNEVKPAP